MADNEPQKKFYLTDSSEWLLLQELSTRLSYRKALYLPTPQIDAGLHVLEAELRHTCILIVQTIPQNLLEEQFDQCQTALKNLCLLLDRLALQGSSRGNLERPKYAHLRELIAFLDSTSEAVDLVIGPNEKLFELPNGADDLSSCLRTVTNCKDALSGLLTPSRSESAVQPPRIHREKTAWKKSKVRNQARCVIKALFEHFKCGMSHEVLLKLMEDQNEDLLLPNLQFMLSPCLDLEFWEEAQYDDTNP
jgi:hypothetical protein